MTTPPPLDKIDIRKIRPWLNSIREYCAYLEKKINTISTKTTSTPVASAAPKSNKWAKITTVTDANNYKASIYKLRSDITALETGKDLYVYDLVTALSADDWIVVQWDASLTKYVNAETIGLF